MVGISAISVAVVSDAVSAAGVMQTYITPTVRTLSVIGTLLCIFFLVNGGIAYLTSTGKPQAIEHAKRIIRNALIGLVLILGAATLVQILTHVYGTSDTANHVAPLSLTAITPKPVSNGLVDVIIKAITGVLNNIIQSLASPFIHSLAYFTKSTPLMAENTTVFNLWRMVVGITDALFVLVVILLGFHVMGASTFGFDEIEFKHLLPQLGLVFLVFNTSIFMIDGIIELSNVMIRAANAMNGSTSLWDVLGNVVERSAELGFAALLIMLLFTVFSVILVVYYIARLITLYIGAIVSPLVLVLWLIPGFRGFTETAAKTYLMTIFVLFVQVIILIVSGSLISDTVGNSATAANTLMPMISGVASMYVVLQVPATMTRMSFASISLRSARQLSGQFINGMSFVATTTQEAASRIREQHFNSMYSRPNYSIGGSAGVYRSPQNDSVTTIKPAAETGGRSKSKVTEPLSKSESARVSKTAEDI